MKSFFRGLFLIMLMIAFSCEKGLFINCNDCVTEEPLKTKLDVRLSLNLGYAAYFLTVNIYEGNIEDSVLFHSWHAYSNSNTFPDMAGTPPLSLNKKYTATATYLFYGDKTYVAIDSAFPRVKYEKSLCGPPCYYIYDKTLNLELKYE